MRRRLCSLIVVVLSILWVAASALSAPEIIRVRDIKPGMKGYGLTVFQGTKIERFEVEVLGVLPKANVGHDLIFIKMLGGPLNSRGVNIAAGMSGSPIYINGKLAGAVSMTFWGFPKEPQCLVTPIEDMLEALDHRLPKEPAGMVRAQAEPQTVTFGGRRIVIAPDNAPPASGDELVFTRPFVPVMVSGLSARGVQRLNALLQPYNLYAMPGPGRAQSLAKQMPPLQPGSAVGVALVTGDVDVSAIGTVTYCDGNRVLIFGHPLMGIGAIEAPLTNAYVFDVVPSYSRSVKIAAPVNVVGVTTQDRLFSVAGELGKRPRMVPVTVDVEDLTTGRKRRFQAQVVQHPLLTGQLVSLVAYETLSQIRGTPGDSLARVQMSVVADEVGTVSRENVVFDDVDIASSATADLDSLMNILTSNPFYPVAIKSVSLQVRFESKRQTATIERVFVRKGRYEPGETVDLGVVLKPYRGQPITRSISLTLPQSLRSGRYTLQVRGGLAPSLTLLPGLVIRTTPTEQSPPTNLQQMVNRFLERERNNDLVVRLLLPTSTVNIGGERFSQMPPTMGALMRSGKSSALRLERDEVKLVLPTEWVLSGSQTLVLNVQRRDSSETRPSELPAPPGEPLPPDSAPPVPPPGVPAMLESGTWGEETQLFADSAFLAQSKTQPARSAPADTKPSTPTAQQSTTRESGEKEEKPVARTPQVWTQTEQADFAKGFFDRTTATSDGDVRLSLTLSRAVDTGKPFVWSLTPANDGSLLLCTGHEGEILRLTPDGKLSTWCRLPEMEVHWLVADGEGWLAGTSPRGRIYRISPDGKFEQVAQLEQNYPVCAVRYQDGSVLVGAGGSAGVVYRVRDGQAEVLLQTGQNHVTALTASADGTVYVGTGDNATLWRISADGSAQAVRDFGEGAVSALSACSDGSLLVALTRSQVIRLYPDGRTRMLIERSVNPILAFVPAPDGSVFACGSSVLYQIFSDNRVNLVENRLDVDFTGGVWWQNALWLGTANGGELYTARNDRAEGIYTSAVHDARFPAQWGTLYWIAETPEGTSVEISTRSGNVPEPDASWSEWSSALTSPGDRITSPPARYIQYRAVLRTRNPQVSPRLLSVSLYYRTQNQPPRVSLKSPKGGAVLSGEASVEWQAEDPDKDTLSYKVYYRAEGEREWREMPPAGKSTTPSTTSPSGEKAEERQATQQDELPSVEEMMADLRQQIDNDPNIPPEVKAEILASAQRDLPQVRAAMQEQARNQPRPSESAEPAPPAQLSTATARKWDTRTLKDGTYRLRVVASDRPSNATDALSAEAISEPILVCNSKPVIVVPSRDGVQIGTDGTVQVSGFVLQKLVPVTAVQVRIGEGEWLSAEAVDGVFDSPLETFRFRSDKLPAGEHQITVKAFNAAGLSATWQKKVTVKAGGGER
ncbi:MAG: hypothetical protein HPY54_02945 [Chthonomonadetes bacterium]|nr:hypothetical protein [Chthonomonadetes bacterium]